MYGPISLSRHFLFILLLFSVTRIGTPLTMDMFDWTKENATLYNGVVLAVAGVISIGVFMVLKVIAKRCVLSYRPV